MLGDQVFGNNDIINLPRNTYAECVKYIVDECDAVSRILPVRQLDQDFGRATRGACLALKSRVLLTAASPLFNGGGIVKSGAIASVIAYPTYDANRWATAAEAALDVINMGQYSLVVDNTTTPGLGFYRAFLTRLSPEIIFEFTQPLNRDFEGQFNPPSRSGGFYTQPTQGLVDAYDMINGKPITDATSGYDPANPYARRDPRLRYTVTWNGSSYTTNANVQAPVYTYLNAPTDGLGIATTTGYYARKMCDTTISFGNGALSERGYALIRYAETLLNYAEAINETGQTETAVSAINQLRSRAGIQAGTNGRYGIPVGITQDAMRTLIQKERRTEMAFEDTRFYDERRWKIAEAIENGFNTIMSITPKVPGRITTLGTDYNYAIQNSVRKHVFFPANYLMPIPQTEVLKIPLMLQNPGY
ncbi:MAG: RagB/SusD family nutrient uptake outer membrane protein [Sphingobacteriaceae bacterium]|nr:MAG: RagB/SusD family nutrient uptake outer membrane protein [Sphingobacteriaceae bacterium]